MDETAAFKKEVQLMRKRLMDDAAGKEDIPISHIRKRWDEMLASMHERTSLRQEQGSPRGIFETEWNSLNFPLPTVFTGGIDAWRIKARGDDNLLDISAGRGRDSNMTETGQLKYQAGVPLETSKWKMPQVKREPLLVRRRRRRRGRG